LSLKGSISGSQFTSTNKLWILTILSKPLFPQSKCCKDVSLIAFIAFSSMITVQFWVMSNFQAFKAKKGIAMTALDKAKQVVPPPMSKKDIEMARVAQRLIMESLDHSRAAAITLTTDLGEHPSVDLPPAALRFIGQLLGAMSEGRPITLIPSKREFSTVEAANFINVSRPFVIKEMEAGRLKYRMVGTHRRVTFEDLVEYMDAIQKKQQAALDRMSENARELGLDY